MTDTTREKLFYAVQDVMLEDVGVDTFVTECEEAWMEALRQRAETDQHAWSRHRKRQSWENPV